MFNTSEEARNFLTESLKRRSPTWQVASAITALKITPVDSELGKELKELAGRPSWAHQEMNDDFDRVVTPEAQLATLYTLFPQIQKSTLPADATDKSYLKTLRRTVKEALRFLGAPEEYTAEQTLQKRHQINWNDSVFANNALTKRLRFLANFENKIERASNVTRLRHAQMQAKSRLAYLVNPSALDDKSLAYVAYVAARANRRSLFLLGGQSKAFDTISAKLFKLLDKSSAWKEIALVAPTPNVLSRVTDSALDQLIGLFSHEMRVAASELGKLYPSLPERMRNEMVMVKGVDSSSWNAYAGALNTMRSAWVAAIQVAGSDYVFDEYLPGKAPRLMASDIVWWSRESGDSLHGDTQLFNALPLPWDVVSGKASLTREQILSTAKKLNVDVDGWVAPRLKREPEKASAEPASVHGVIIDSPELAPPLRKAGCFSGKF